jgi:hypothetical protein
MDTDDAPWFIVLREVQQCALAWEGAARLLGNVRACDIARAIQEVNVRITELEKELDDLREGRTAILPKNREHALNLLTVAEAFVHGRPPTIEPL